MYNMKKCDLITDVEFTSTRFARSLEWWTGEGFPELVYNHELEREVRALGFLSSVSSPFSPDLFAPFERVCFGSWEEADFLRDLGRCASGGDGQSAHVFFVRDGATRQEVEAAFSYYIRRLGLPEMERSDSSAMRHEIDYLGRLRDLAALRFRRAGIVGGRAKRRVADAMREMCQAGDLRKLLMELPRHQARCAARAERVIEREFRLRSGSGLGSAV